MKIPISFDEVPYFKNEYRGDLIVSHGVLYYFPHTRVSASRHAPEIGGKDGVDLLNALGIFVPFVGIAPWLHTVADKSIKLRKLLSRSVRPSINSPRLTSIGLWNGMQTSEQLQRLLDKYIDQQKKEKLSFEHDSVPKPLRFAASEIEDLRFGVNLKFAARYDTHDFRINPLHRRLVKAALLEAGFI